MPFKSVVWAAMDDIQRKLELIDKQLAGRRDFHQKIISTAPLLFAAAGLIVGIVIESIFSLRDVFWFALLVVSTLISVGLFIFQKRAVRLAVFAYAALICFICLGGVRLNRFNRPEVNDIRNFVKKEQTLTTIKGLIDTEPRIYRNKDWEFAQFTHTDPSSSFYLKVNEVETDNGWTKAAGTVRVQVGQPLLDLKAGDYIQAYCWLDRFVGPSNPGQFNIAKYLARKAVFIGAYVDSREAIKIQESGSGSILRQLKNWFRQKSTQALVGDASIEEQNRGLLEALLLGYRGDINSDIYRAFRKTGLLHFISLSGMHLGILIGIIWWLCKTMGLMKRWRAAVCIIAICIFLLIVPPRDPTIRAAIIGIVFCISFFFRRHPNSINTLSLAAIILLLIRPTGLFEAGWQLSFASVLGLLLFCRRIHFFLYEKITGLPWFEKAPKAKPFFRIVSRPGPYLLRLFSMGLTAWLSGAGILLYHFYTINPLTSIWTVIAFPFVALILILGYFKIILSFLLPTLSMILGFVVNGLSYGLIWVVEFFAGLGISQILIGHVSLTPIILYYCFVLFTAYIYFRRPLLKKAICILMFSTIILFLGVTKWQRTHRKELVITALDVGHGQAILAQLPGGANILFDAGSLYRSDIGSRIVVPFLDYSGTSKIDAIIISHNDVDHINGIPEIVENRKVKTVYACDAFTSESDEWGTEKFLKNCLNNRGFEIQRLPEQLKIKSAVKVSFLWPNRKIHKNEQLSDNDKSLVSLIEFGSVQILLCSDIEKFAQKELLRLFPNLSCDVVVVPHHGSINTILADFTEKLDASISICSCSRRQYESQQVKRRNNDSKWLYTARDGALTITANSGGLVSAQRFLKEENQQSR
ncbi:DNA internalization-related competence protein ComEC/Rec2 [Planctomycetota bacterium]